LPPPSRLRVVRCEEGKHPGYYLFYDDDTGQEMTDTWHETIEAALKQAHWEFRIRPEEWEIVEEGSE
jgi:hypothetical protein